MKTKMNSEQEIGVKVESSYNVRMQRKAVTKHIAQFAVPFITAFATISTLMCLTSGLRLTLDVSKLILFASIFSVSLWGLTLFRTYAATILPLTMFCFVLFLNEKMPWVLEGIYHMENYVITAMNSYYKTNLELYVVAEENPREPLTIFFILLAFIIAWAYTYFIYQCKGAVLYFVLTIPFIAVPCILGKMPDKIWFLCFMISVVGMLSVFSSSQIGGWYKGIKGKIHIQTIGISVGLTCMVIVTLFVIVLNTIVTDSMYNELPISTWKVALQKKLENVSKKNGLNKLDLVNDYGLGDGGLDGGKLDTETGKIVFRDSPQLEVTTEQSTDQGLIYLKGFTGTNYTGDAWVKASRRQRQDYREILDIIEDYYISENYTSMSALSLLGEDTIQTRDMRIDYKNANMEYFYYPYYTWFFTENAFFDSDYVYNQLRQYEDYPVPVDLYNQYRIVYYDMKQSVNNLNHLIRTIQTKGVDTENYPQINPDCTYNSMQFAAMKQCEELYEKYVHDVYLSLPAGKLDRLIEECIEARPLLFQDSDVLQDGVDVQKAIEFVRTYLWEAADYSLEPGRLPDGKDYVEYFIYDNHKGYCAHYATAATLMLRALGVPARYCEGYCVGDTTKRSSDGNEYVYHVTDMDAHAWVEVYIEQYGWYPVEFTESSMYQTKEASVNPHAKKEKKTTPTSTPKKDKKVTPTPKPTKQPTKKDKIQPEKKHQESFFKTHQIESLSLSALVILIAAIILFHRYRCWWWRKYLRKYNYSERIVIWYEQIEKIRVSHTTNSNHLRKITYEWYEKEKDTFGNVDYEMIRQINEVYLKAAFSNNCLEQMEYQQTCKNMIKLYYSIYATKNILQRKWIDYYVMIRFDLGSK